MKRKSLLARLLIAITSLISASIYLWSAIAYKHEEFYKHVSPLSVCMILFYFNVFMVNIKIENNIKLSKFINILFVFCIVGFVVFSNIYNFFVDSSHPIETSIIRYFMFGILEFLYGGVLICLIAMDYESRLMDNEDKLIRLFCLQFAYIITTLSQVIPLYMQKQIPLTNDFVYLFWLLYILDENTNIKKKSISHNFPEVTEYENIKDYEAEGKKKFFNKMFAVIFVVATVISVYLFSVVNYYDENNRVIYILRDVMSFISSFCFYGWSLLSFHKASHIVIENEYRYGAL